MFNNTLFNIIIFPFIILFFAYELLANPARVLEGSGAVINEIGQWTKAAPLPSFRYEFAAGALDGKVFTIGGIVLPSVWFPTNIVEIYDPKTDTWERGKKYPERVHHTGAAVCNDKLYVVGGNDIRITPKSSVYAYDIKKDSWQKRASLPTARGALGVTCLDGLIYAVGGGVNKRPVNNLDVYNPTTNTWSSKAAMFTTREHLFAVAVKGKVYALGGFGETRFDNLVSNEAYDPATDTWERLAPMPYPVSGFAAVGMGNSIFIFGGEQGDAVSKEVHEYKIDEDKWFRRPDLPAPRYALTATVVGNSIHVIGGNDMVMGYEFSRSHDVFTP